VSYELGDPLKGGLRVCHQGRHLAGAALIMAGAVLCGDDIEIGEGALVESGVLIKGPSIIGPCSEVRQGAYVRGGVMSSVGSIIGHVTEAKNTLLMPGAKAGHFAYLGDSILGREVNLGAGTKLANLKMNDQPYIFRNEGQRLVVKRRKFGAIIGDHSETGCNTVTNPGTLLGPKTRVLPNSSLAPGYRPGQTFLNR
jgi:NDP-sugar pyrophosphorylase family protein